MADSLSPEKRSWNMSRIRGKDTSIEVKVRKYLFSQGFRYRKHVASLPGKPDIVLPKYHAVVFVNGCFWHRHPGCKEAYMPKSRVEFWQEKFERNVQNDALHRNELIDAAASIWNNIKNAASTIWNNIKNAVSTIWNGIKQVVGSLAQGLANHVSILFNGLKNTIVNIWSAIKNTASSAWNGLKNLVSSIASNLKQTAVNAFKSMVSGIGFALSSLGSVVQSGFQSAISFITSLPGKALEWGKDFINGIADGIRSTIGNVVNAVSDVADKIRSFLHFSVPDEGPLTDYESWMPDFMSGLAKGIEKSRDMVKKAVSGVASELMLQPQAAVQGMQVGRDSSGDSSVSELLGGLQEMLVGLQEMAGGGIICIPVYVGGTLLDEVVVDAQARQNLRSGGR